MERHSLPLWLKNDPYRFMPALRTDQLTGSNWFLNDYFNTSLLGSYKRLS